MKCSVHINIYIYKISHTIFRCPLKDDSEYEGISFTGHKQFYVY